MLKLLLLLFFIYGCGIDGEYVPDVNIVLETNLEQIDDHTYILDIDTTRWQTIHMIDFYVEADGKPVEYATIRFSSDLFWIVGDTSGYIISQSDGQGLYVSADTSYILEITSNHVPTTNYRSMTGMDGTTSNALSPILTMRGEYMNLAYSVWVEEAMNRYEGHIHIYLR